MLIIATPNPDSVAETFIHQHIRLTDPGNTGVLYFEGVGKSVQDLPNLKVETTKKQSVFYSLIKYILNGYSGALAKKNKKETINFLKKNNASCILAEFGQTGCKLLSVCLEMNIPLFVFFHGHDASAAARKLRNRISYWRMSLYAKKVFVATHFFATKVNKAGVLKRKIHVIPYGLDVEVFGAKSKDDNLILAVGRMVEKKAPHLTVQAFAKTARKIKSLRLEMIGEGPLLERTKKMAVELGVEDKIVFHGAKEHSFVRIKMAQASLFVQHSLTAPNGDTESLGVSLLEAMASEVPVVATSHNGFVETIADGETGFLVPEGDIDAMAAKMTQLMADKTLRKKMGTAGRKRVMENYDAHKQSYRLLQMLTS
ncbi:MAG: glycosyltransferase involved in cell wall biosynthesis [Salibacteraceae bacterium]|jgi:glycosyltransferase involved in cell wall biosynthesis